MLVRVSGSDSVDDWDGVWQYVDSPASAVIQEIESVLGNYMGTGQALDGFTAARSWAESVGGSLVIEAAPDDLRAEWGTWGTAPASVGLQREMKQRFDPAEICNTGILPGGV